MRPSVAGVLALIVLAVPACRGSGPPHRSDAAASSPVLGVHHGQSLTEERYHAVVRALTGGHDRLRSVTDGGIEGLLVHLTAKGDDGFWVIDVWASQEAVDRFARRVRPLALSAGIDEPMKTYPVDTWLSSDR
jgi:hypothetical protein